MYKDKKGEPQCAFPPPRQDSSNVVTGKSKPPKLGVKQNKNKRKK